MEEKFGTEEKRGTTFRSSTDAIFKTFTWNNKTRYIYIVKEIKQYQKKWLQHVQRIDTNRLPKQALQYKKKDEGT